MGITEYITARKEGQKLSDTLTQRIYEASVEVGKSLYGSDGLIDKEKLNDNAERTKAVQKFQSSLEDAAASYFNATPTDSFRKSQLSMGLFGITSDYIKTHLETEGTRFDTGKLAAHSLRNNVFGYFQNQRINELPKAKLDNDQANEVVQHTKLQGKVDPNKLEVTDMGELLNEWMDQKGTVTDAFLDGKRYHIKPAPVSGTQRATGPNVQ